MELIMDEKPIPIQFWGGRGWVITLDINVLIVEKVSGVFKVKVDTEDEVRLQRRWLRWRLETSEEESISLPGIKRAQRKSLKLIIRFLPYVPQIDKAKEWKLRVRSGIDNSINLGRWIPRELRDGWESERARTGLLSLLSQENLESCLSDEQRDALNFASTDLVELTSNANSEIMESELVGQRHFFDLIEKSPLTDEQARAVICFDNRVQLLAAAGSGKTSVMVARAAYAVEKEFIQPSRILLLAFNRAAAEELQERVRNRFRAAGIESFGVQASTFHALGMKIIGKATGKKPTVAPWLDEASSRRKILEIVTELSEDDETFRYNWDLFRLIYPDAPAEPQSSDYDAYDKGSKQSGYLSASGDIVKSEGERKIADFLFFNMIPFQYEAKYSVSLSDSKYGQYRPDFYYPDIKVWHEHWALGKDGKPPASFLRYRDSMDWKKAAHQKYGTTLLESTWYDVIYGKGIPDLAKQLSQLGLEGTWSPDRTPESRWYQAMDREQLAGFVRTFMSHVKSNSWTEDDLAGRVDAELLGLDNYRTQLFLSIYWPIHRAWQRHLAAEEYIDFEDMLVEATKLCESGAYESPFDLILVDEFQDVSQARARLLSGLLKPPGRYLLAVGDDWQSINRFAGADVSIMTDFGRWFGEGPRMAITTTFRSPEPISMPARDFVLKNPKQLTKEVTATRTGDGPGIQVIRTTNPADEVVRLVERLGRSLERGAIKSLSGRDVSVDILGRYNFQKDLVPKQMPKGIVVRFRTVHKSKGSEADFIIVPGMTIGKYGFPSHIEDDPLLKLALPQPEVFDFAEERRLFYVALTRARQSVYLLTEEGNISPFITELLKAGAIARDYGGDAPMRVCTECGIGTLKVQRGAGGSFLGCSRFPACTYTESW